MSQHQGASTAVTSVSTYLLRPLRSYAQASRDIRAKRRAEARAMRRMDSQRQPRRTN